MRRLTFLLAACLCWGCYNAPDSTTPAPVPATLDGASAKAIQDYATGMADLCDSTAADLEAGKFKAQSQVADQFKAKSQALRQDVFGRLGKSMDAVVTPGVDLSPKETADAYRKMASGFRKAVGK